MLGQTDAGPDDLLTVAGGHVMSTALKLLAREVLADAEDHVADSARGPSGGRSCARQDYSEADPRGEYRTGDVTPGRAVVARADVADFVLDVIENGRYPGDLPTITDRR